MIGLVLEGLLWPGYAPCFEILEVNACDLAIRWFKWREAVLQPDSIVRMKRDQALKQSTCSQRTPLPPIAGNDAFKKMDYPEAIRHYTEALKRNPNDHRVSSLKSVLQADCKRNVPSIFFSADASLSRLQFDHLSASCKCFETGIFLDMSDGFIANSVI